MESKNQHIILKTKDLSIGYTSKKVLKNITEKTLLQFLAGEEIEILKKDQAWAILQKNIVEKFL